MQLSGWLSFIGQPFFVSCVVGFWRYFLFICINKTICILLALSMGVQCSMHQSAIVRIQPQHLVVVFAVRIIMAPRHHQAVVHNVQKYVAFNHLRSQVPHQRAAVVSMPAIEGKMKRVCSLWRLNRVPGKK